MKTYVKDWYDFLEQDKIMGLKCRRCGSYEFPAVAICNNCSAAEDFEWVEMSGEGELVSFSVALFPDPWMTSFGTYLHGAVKMKEGTTFHAMILGIDPMDTETIYKKTPIKVKAETQQRDGYKYVAFRVAE